MRPASELHEWHFHITGLCPHPCSRPRQQGAQQNEANADAARLNGWAVRRIVVLAAQQVTTVSVGNHSLAAIEDVPAWASISQAPFCTGSL